ANGNPLRNELGTVANGYTMFRFGNVDVILYDDAFQDKNGNTLTVLAEGKGILVPRTKLGATVYAPASTLSGLGSVGSKRFAQTYRDPKDRYIEVESEQSTLVINEQFGATVEISIA
ncbi:major capsid protein, partial [Escherichia coli]|uniref:major capsid protein n=1 Tax=Escherichia coli TaxID=562 RepID=UPI002B246537